MSTQAEKAAAFRRLHERSAAFVIPNPWDAGSARLLQHLGFEALATTSAGAAFSLARADGAISRDQALANAGAIVEACDLPVSADLENGYGDTPEACAETIRLAAAVGLVGGSIEDSTGDADRPIYAFDQAVARVRAAVEAARALPFAFTLTARCENFLHGRRDLADTIRRLQAYEAAGADVLFAPGVAVPEEIAAVVNAVSRPVNLLAGNPAFTVADLSALGVKRISTGGGLSLAAFGALMAAAGAIRERGSFDFLAGTPSYADLNRIFSSPGG